MMAKKNRVSVILQAYNHAKYIRQSIDSVLGQFFSDFNLFIIDDGSADETWSIIDSYSDPRIQAFRNETPRRVENARWAIADLAVGEYIAIQHSDDIWEPNKLEKQIAFLDANPEIGAVFTWAQIIDDDGQPFQDENHFYYKIFEQPNRTRHEWLNYFFYHGNALCHPSVLIRKNCYEDVGLYRYGFSQLPDFDMWVRLCLKYEIHVLPEKLVRFRVRDNELNTSGNRPDTRVRSGFELLRIYENYLEINTSKELIKIFPAAQAYLHPDYLDTDYALARIFLEPKQPFISKLVGLNLLFDILNTPVKAKSIQKVFGFTNLDFIELTAQNDVMSVKRTLQLESHIVELGKYVQALTRQVAERDAQLHEITISRAWRLVMLLRRIRLFLLPKGSLRENVSKKLFTFLLFILREARQWLASPATQAKRYLWACIRYAKVIYLSLPLSSQIKNAHRLFLIRYFPSILLSVRNIQPTFAPGLHMSSVNPLSLTNLDSVARNINIPTSLQPHVSIIIPFYGKCEYTFHCLSSIAAHPPSISFEIIVVNDNSPDNSAEVLKGVKGIRIISNPENEGFIRSCNIGAKAAKGEYLHFLNNDTEVTPGWLDELVRTFHEFPGTGLAGSKLVYPDGTLQEAGGIIWQDGSAWNFGRNQDQLLPVYNYAREVDYCSGASIMVPKLLFEELGGFDERYLPAYGEDSDLALKIRDREYRVIYQPLSVVVHFEGVTSGTNTSRGVKSHQAENFKKLFQRWENHLANHQLPGTNIDNAKDRMAKRRVLFIDSCTPTPDQDAGSGTALNLMLLLREMEFQVTFIPEDNFLYLPDYTPALQRAGIEALYEPYCKSVEQHLKQYGQRYDLVFLLRPGVIDRNLKLIRMYSPIAKVLYHTMDLHFLRMLRDAELSEDPIKRRDAENIKTLELNSIRAADASIVHSPVELSILRRELPDAKIHVFPLIMPLSGTSKGFNDRRDIAFVGGYQHLPNVDAVQFFVNVVMPILRRQLPGIRFFAVGSNPPAELEQLACEDVVITGYVKDLNSFLDQIRVSVAPLRYGAGIKGKIGTTMSVGLPTVATTLAVEGMSLTDGEQVLIADSAEAIAATVIRLYLDESLWNSISNSGLEFVERTWGAEASWKVLNSILSDIGLESVRGNHELTLYKPFKEYKAAQIDRILLNGRSTALTPVASIKNKTDFEHILTQDAFVEIRKIENRLIESANAEYFTVDGFCIPCNKEVRFIVDMQCGGKRDEGRWVPNWRERLECPHCRMNNRQRLIASIVKQRLDQDDSGKKVVYFMEQITQIFQWSLATFPDHQVIGSEYMGDGIKSGTIIKNIRHEDLMDLSFEDNTLDMIVSNDVFEHVPDPKLGFKECARVIKPGGMLIATFPFHAGKDKSETRAVTQADKLVHLLPPIYHGNPVSNDGSLVFTDFGWEVLDDINSAGFSDAKIEVYASERYCHLGGGQLVFKAIKG